MILFAAGGAALSLSAALGAWLDLTRRRLPNWLCLCTALGGAVVTAVAQGPVGLAWALLHGLVALLVGLALFAAGIVGGGDAKYYAGMALWFGLPDGSRLLLCVTLAGLGMFAVWFTLRRVLGRKVERRPTRDSDKFPYGIAIAAGALWAWFGQAGLAG